jgi:hypothetical protein
MKREIVMKKKLLFILSFCLSITLSAQQTYDIDWGFNSTSDVTPADAPTNADRTIEVGDTVRWIWYSTGNHNVVSTSASQESFNSGPVQPSGTEFTYTFTEVGVNPYICSPHAGIMFGVITVVPQGTLSTSAFDDIAKFDIAPNPGKNWLNINFDAFTTDVKVEVFDVLGKRIYHRKLTQPETSINITNWKSGVYLVRISNEQTTQTKRFIKQ